MDNSYLEQAGAHVASPAAGGSSPAAAQAGEEGAGASEPVLSQPMAECFSQPECRNVWLQAAHYATLRGFVQQHLLQRLLAAVVLVEWPLTIARRLTIPLLEQVQITPRSLRYRSHGGVQHEAACTTTRTSS